MIGQSTTSTELTIIYLFLRNRTRDPDQVFQLLQTVFQGFDDIAQRRKVFKVETIGDCYVAVTGLVSHLQK